MFTFIIIVLIVIAFVVVISNYNNFVQLNNKVKEAFFIKLLLNIQ